ncbi:MAG: hypothetical protein M1419_01360 [Bacteroidetes bacterium]|nr:hypothetical protein [Bacteroidota bacterium]
MKNMLTLLASVAALTLVFSACTSVYTGEEYYGYSPKHKQNNDKDMETLFDDEKNSEVQSSDWQNPLANNDDNSTVGVRQVYYDYNPMYVPVIVPWWYGYYGWMSYPYPRYGGPHFYIGFGYNPYYDLCWDWYSPWYDYHPYYGYNWSNYNYGWGYYGWFNQPYYSYNTGSAPRRNRDFGPNRNGREYSSGNDNGGYRVNRTGFSTTSNDYSSGVRTINTTSGNGYNRRSAVKSNSGDEFIRSNGNTSSGIGYNRTDTRSTSRDAYKSGAGNNYSAPNRTSQSVNRTIETVKGILNNRNSSSDGNSNSGSTNRGNYERQNSGNSSPTYNRSSEGSSYKSSTPTYSGSSNRSSSPTYTAPSRSSSPSYTAPSRSSSGSSSGSSRSSGSGSGSNSSSGRRGR